MSDKINPNLVFRGHWDENIGTNKKLSLNDPGLTAQQRQTLAKADGDGDGKLSMREARDYLVVSSKVRQDGVAQDFRAVLNHIFTQRAGRQIDVTGQAHILYLQFNNAGNKTLVEERDLKAHVKADPDHPSLDRVNITDEFNTEGNVSKATSAFKKAMRTYMDQVLKDGGEMTGLIISGHSDGTDLLQETEDHDYHGNLDIRKALRQLRQEKPEYARLMDGCEKVGLLACFQGGAIAEWREIFPHATIAGTTEFAPVAASHSSAAIYRSAQNVHQALENGLAPATGRNVGINAYSRGDLRTRGLQVGTPDPATARRTALKNLKLAEQSYDKAKVAQMRAGDGGQKADGTKYSADEMRQIYACAMSYYNARKSVWIATGRPGGVNGPEAKKLERLLYEAQDLFAIRMHQNRPTAPVHVEPASIPAGQISCKRSYDGGDYARFGDHARDATNALQAKIADLSADQQAALLHAISARGGVEIAYSCYETHFFNDTYRQTYTFKPQRGETLAKFIERAQTEAAKKFTEHVHQREGQIAIQWIESSCILPPANE